MRRALPFLFALVLPALCLSAQEKHTLRFRFEPGQTAWLLQTMEMKQQMVVQDRPMDMTFTTRMWMEAKVTAVKDGVATIEQRYARVQVKMDGAMMQVDYDSDVEGSDPGPMAMMADFVGKTATIRVDARGTMHGIELPEDIAGLPIAKSLKQGFQQQFTAWPEEPVAVGGTWSSRLEFPMEGMGSMKAAITNELLSVQDKIVTVAMEMKMDTSGLTMPGGMEMEIGKAKGTVKYSLDSFLPIDSTIEMEMKMGGDGAPMRMTMVNKTSMQQIEPPAPKPRQDAPKDAGK